MKYVDTMKWLFFILSVANSYSRSKLMIEEFLQDVFVSDDGWYRYFNPVDRHKSKLIGESLNDIYNNLIPLALLSISQAEIDKLEKLNIFGLIWKFYGWLS